MKILKNYIYNSSYQLFLIILPIITLPYLSRVLGPTYLGINSYTYSITNYFILFAVLGTTTYAQREVAYLKDDIGKLKNFFWEIEILNLLSTVVSYSLLIVTIYLLPNYHIFLWAYSISVLANLLDISWLLMGMENFSILALRNFFIKTISVLLIFILVKNKNDLIIYILINSLSILFSNLLLWPYVKKIDIFIHKNEFKKLHPLRHLSGTVALFIPQVAITLYTVLNKVFLGYMGKIKAESYFDNADKIVRLSFTILLSVSTVLMPVIASEISKNKIDHVKSLLKKSLSFSLCIAIAMTAGIMGISEKLVPLFFGSQYISVIPLLKIQAFIILPMSIANVIGNQYLVPARKIKALNISIFSGSIFNIIISIPMISFFGARGASYAILMSETLVTTVQILQVQKELNFKNIYGDILKYCVSALIMFLFLKIEQAFISGWLSIVLGILIGVIVYLGCLIVLKASILNFGLEEIKSKLLK